MRNYFNFRYFYLLAFPIIFSLLFFVIFQSAEDGIEKNYREIFFKKWKNRAEFSISSIRNGWSVSFQLQQSFQEMENSLLSNGWEGSEDFKQCLKLQLKDKLSKDCLKNSRIWAFSMNKGNPGLIRGEGLEHSTRRIMEKAFFSLCDINDNRHKIAQPTMAKHIKLLNGVFGQNSIPQHLGGTREGMVTPVFFSGEYCYLVWKSFKKDDDRAGGLIAVFNESFVDSTEKGLKNYADQSFKKSHNTLATAFFRSKQMSDQFISFIPNDLEKAASEKNQILRVLRTFWLKSDTRILRKILIRNGYAFYIDNISLEIPYYTAVISKLPEPLSFLKFRASKVFLYLPLFWVGFLGFKLKFDSGRIMRLGVSFKSLFFLTGMLPVSFLFYIGAIQIFQNQELEIFRHSESAFSKIAGINEGYENLFPTIREFLLENVHKAEFQDLCLSGSKDDHSRAFNVLRDRLTERGFDLTYLSIMLPGKEATFVCASPELKILAENHTKYFTVSAYVLHNSLAKGSPGFKKIHLNSEQKSLAESLMANNDISRPEDIILTSLNKATSLQFSNDEKVYYFSCIIFKDETIRGYLAMGINLEEVNRIYLREEFANLNKSNVDDCFYAAKSSQVGTMQFLPAQPNNFANSKVGKKFREFLRSACNSESQLSLIDKDKLFLYSPFTKVSQYLAGGILDISDIYRDSKLSLLHLLLIIALLGSTIYILSAYLSHLMVEPLLKVTEVFNRVSERNFETGFSYPHNNELGMLAESTEKMITGLKERQLIGRFVSTTLDENEKLDETFQSAKSMNGTVLFSDIRSFTTLSEKYPPEKIADMLNTHLAEMVEIIIAYGGQVEQFIGDAIVAFFPETIENCADKAIMAAVKMMAKHHELQLLRENADEFAYDIGIGLDYGVVMAGVLSTSQRSEFTILGPARTFAEHLESESRYGRFSKIILSENTLQQMKMEIAFAPVKDCNYFEISDLEGKQ